MEWEGRQESSNVEDRRGWGTKAAVGGAGGLVILVVALLLGVDPQRLTDIVGKPEPGGKSVAVADPEEEKQVSFTKVILRDTEDVWNEQFRKLGKKYQEPVLVIFRDQVQSACGMADSAVGPFYCPADHRLYIDLSFYKDMERQLNAPGEFARAYVIAHEVGHHVQNLLGYSDIVHRARQTQTKTEQNRMSVRLELQADFLAGVWAHHGQKQFNFLEKGDMESALNAAYQIGDDRLQKRSRGTVVPDAFTHGTSKQRMRWFREGFETGDVKRADLLFKLKYDEL
jgi:hypothetical protein